MNEKISKWVNWTENVNLTFNLPFWNSKIIYEQKWKILFKSFLFWCENINSFGKKFVIYIKISFLKYNSISRLHLNTLQGRNISINSNLKWKNVLILMKLLFFNFL